MARILSSLIGDLRGSIGGQTYSRNKAGAFIRQRVKPVNPQTPRQQNARYRFGNMSILFQSLTTAQKNCWEDFAKTHFNPLKGNNTGIYSAGNAFVALRQSASQGNEYRGTPTAWIGGTTVNVTTYPYNEVTSPPFGPSSATIKTIEDTVQQITVDNIFIGGDGTYSFNLKFPGQATDNPLTFDSFSNAEGDGFGIGLYVSNVLKFEGSKPNTALKTNFADTGVIETVTIAGGEPVPINDPITFRGTSTMNVSNVRDFPCAGDVVLATAFLRTTSGVQKLISSQYVTAIETVSPQ